MTAKPALVDSPLVTRDCAGPVMRLTLSSPPANALSIAMMEALSEALAEARDDADVRVVVIAAAAAGKVFSAGHDLKEMALHRADEDGGRVFFERMLRLCADLMQAIADHPKPVIAEIDGAATATGCQLVATCDLAICTDASTFCVPGVDLALMASPPMVALSRAAHRKQAMEMLLTGETIDASTAKEFGIVNRIVPKEYLGQVVQKYAEAIATKPAGAVRAGKRAFQRQAEMSTPDAYDLIVAETLEGLMGAEAEEGVNAVLQKRKPKWTGE